MRSLKKALVLTAFALFPAIAHAGESFEACTVEGPCALRVTDMATGTDVWLVTDENSPLQSIWAGTFWQVSEADYAEIRELIPDEQKTVVPGINPTTGETMRAKGGSAPAGGGKTGGGPLVGGTVTIGDISIGGGGDSSCRACHTGSMREIHKKVLDKKE